MGGGRVARHVDQGVLGGLVLGLDRGQLQPLGQTPTEKGPRGFAIDPSGRYLIAAGQESHSISLYAIDAATGALGKPERLAVGKNPNWIEIVDLP